MILPIVTRPNPILRQKAKLVDPNEIPQLSQLISDMFETLEARGGVGLAAPQVGLDLNLFIIRDQGERRVFINPVVLDASSIVETRPEGCLSLPGLVLDVPRSIKIKVMYRDMDGNQQVSDYEEGWARIFLHEFDHLQGIMIDDRVGKVSLMMAKKRAAKLQRRRNMDRK